ncbi:EipA family protein, partial [Acinetobacter baumannii]|uniref:EipA family protein n=1 Tax=Acinetobacter baumannii TaxID=470 RepID=UPI0013D619F7
PYQPQQPPPAGQAPYSPGGSARQQATTYQRDELVGAAEGVFGKGASGLGKLIEDILKDQGQPNAYIAGSEAAGDIGVG